MKSGKHAKSMFQAPDQGQAKSNPSSWTPFGWPSSNPSSFGPTPVHNHSSVPPSSSANLMQFMDINNGSQTMFSPLPISAHKDGVWYNGMPNNQVSSGSEPSMKVASGADGNSERHHWLNGSVLGNRSDAAGEDLEPCEGMVFESLDAAQRFYTSYANRLGFRIRVDRTQTSAKTGAICSCTYACFREGPSKSGSSGAFVGQKRQQSESRELCKAKIVLTLSKQGKWVVSTFVKEHNHDLVESSMVGWMRSQRHMEGVQKEVIKTFADEGVSPKQMISAMTMTEATKGADNLPLAKHGVRNYAIRKKRKYTDKCDAQTTIDLLAKMKEENPSFFYKFQLDDEKRLTNIFWVDARSRMDYHYFGDVISFDVIYSTNVYEKPFAPFIGVNHHNQTVLFGCGLLQDESIESYVWLFETWLEAMLNHPPAAIITSQESSIIAAVAKVFPKAHHRLCMWYIMKNFHYMLPKQLPDGFRDQLKACIHKSKTVDEFEAKWEVLLKRYGMGNIDWLESLYQIRHQWVPVYLRDKFFAEMSTTTRIRTLKSFFDVNAKTTLVDFVKQYAHAVNDRFRQESIADYESKYKPFQMIFNSSIEMQAAQVYTRTAFQKFQRELKKSKNYSAEVKDQVGEELIFVVSKCENANVTDTVSFNVSGRKSNCTCCHFEYAGIICRHILKVFSIYNVIELPPHQILKRWTKGAKDGDIFDENGARMKTNCNESRTLRYNQFCYRMNQLAEQATSSMTVFNMVMKELDELEKKIGCIKSAAQNGDNDAPEGMLDSLDQTEAGSSGSSSNLLVYDPALAMTKCKSSRAIQPGNEICKKLPRQCKTCFRYGVKHDSRNCPAKRNDGTRSLEDERDESSLEMESWTEVAKPRQCKTCLQYGVNHDSRNCPSRRDYLLPRGTDDGRGYPSPKAVSGTKLTKKPPRQCKSCLQYGVNHDSRNCPSKKNDMVT